MTRSLLFLPLFIFFVIQSCSTTDTYKQTVNIPESTISLQNLHQNSNPDNCPPINKQNPHPPVLEPLPDFSELQSINSLPAQLKLSDSRHVHKIEAENPNSKIPITAGESYEFDQTIKDEFLSKPETDPQVALDDSLELCQASYELWQKGDIEEALQTLDQSYSLIINTDMQNNPKLLQQKDDLRFAISKRILEIYASRNSSVHGKHNEIPLIINKHVQKEITSLTTRERQFFIASYKRAGRYRPMILNELKASGLPAELSWLPLIESGFKVNALSKARALGLWQFIPSTGYKFGLKRNQFIDERLDPHKSTMAAISYLKALHNIFGDWSTVLAAYNCGEGRVLRQIRSQNIKYLDNFWDLYQRLPYETARYVPRFLATLHIVQNPEKYGLSQITPYSPYNTETITINRQLHLKNIAKAINLSFNDLKALNPDLRNNITPDRPYQLKVPSGAGSSLLSKVNRIPKTSLPQRAYVYHRIQKGESLSTIARRYRTSTRRIIRTNNLRNSHFIVAGKRLKIPVGRGYVSERKNSRSSNSMKTYRVKRGDSPYIIAKKLNTPLEKLLKINRLKPGSKIYPGQKLYVY